MGELSNETELYFENLGNEEKDAVNILMGQATWEDLVSKIKEFQESLSDDLMISFN